MDQMKRAWYGMCADVALSKKKEQEYEDFFCSVMESLHSDNFQLVKAAGRDGDGKADGYLVPDQCIFQSYAPSSGFRKQSLMSKIRGDFLGALDSWNDKISKWVFVHNEPEGLPKYALELIEELKSKYKNVDINIWGPGILKEKVMSLPLGKLVDMFGLAPSQEDMTSLTYEPIKTLLRAMGKDGRSKTPDITPVSVEKLQYNKLSPDVDALLTAGRRKENLVEDLLLRWPDPEYGEELAKSFRTKYQSLRSNGASPDDSFVELKSFAGGDTGEVTAQVSSLAVLSYFFERCDIYENPPKGWRA
ncbi:ABC-three component system protein [Microbulbifer sp. CnH-101-G]|uniref:ABC-three component system protein n=1 Tax=Microbulbifer sp. CnH-101-G TaxID=3243393 RepID=UPI0040390CBD